MPNTVVTRYLGSKYQDELNNRMSKLSGYWRSPDIECPDIQSYLDIFRRVFEFVLICRVWIGWITTVYGEIKAPVDLSDLEWTANSDGRMFSVLEWFINYFKVELFPFSLEEQCSFYSPFVGNKKILNNDYNCCFYQLILHKSVCRNDSRSLVVNYFIATVQMVCVKRDWIECQL